MGAYCGVSGTTIRNIERADPGVASGTVRRVMDRIAMPFVSDGGRLHDA